MHVPNNLLSNCYFMKHRVPSNIAYSDWNQDFTSRDRMMIRN
jgi:hypothetical protein